jgi:glutathione S-transferase
MAELPILYSFRRCPYAMRARLAIAASGQQVELREVVLRDKPEEMLAASPKATVPVLILADGTVLEESLDVIDWALGQNDRENWLELSGEQLDEIRGLIRTLDGPFKASLDRYKYENRFDGVSARAERDKGSDFIRELDQMLKGKRYLYGEVFSLADGAILPFIRQFAHVDKEWFWAQDWSNVLRWLGAFLASDRFISIMKKYPKWNAGDNQTTFPD